MKTELNGENVYIQYVSIHHMYALITKDKSGKTKKYKVNLIDLGFTEKDLKSKLKKFIKGELN